jgi:hypothetical protein
MDAAKQGRESNEFAEWMDGAPSEPNATPNRGASTNNGASLPSVVLADDIFESETRPRNFGSAPPVAKPGTSAPPPGRSVPPPPGRRTGSVPPPPQARSVPPPPAPAQSRSAPPPPPSSGHPRSAPPPSSPFPVGRTAAGASVERPRPRKVRAPQSRLAGNTRPP